MIHSIIQYWFYQFTLIICLFNQIYNTYIASYFSKSMNQIYSNTITNVEIFNLDELTYNCIFRIDTLEMIMAYILSYTSTFAYKYYSSKRLFRHVDNVIRRCNIPSNVRNSNIVYRVTFFGQSGSCLTRSTDSEAINLQDLTFQYKPYLLIVTSCSQLNITSIYTEHRNSFRPFGKCILTTREFAIIATMILNIRNKRKLFKHLPSTSSKIIVVLSKDLSESHYESNRIFDIEDI